MRRALSRWAGLSILPADVTIVGCASERVAVRDRAPRTECVVVEPAVATTTTPPVGRPAAPLARRTHRPAPRTESRELGRAPPEAAHVDLGASGARQSRGSPGRIRDGRRHPERNREMTRRPLVGIPGARTSWSSRRSAAASAGMESYNVMAKHQAGAGLFLEWTRRHPVAVEELIGHPSGLLWAGQHLYPAEWRH